MKQERAKKASWLVFPTSELAFPYFQRVADGEFDADGESYKWPVKFRRVESPAEGAETNADLIWVRAVGRYSVCGALAHMRDIREKVTEMAEALGISEDPVESVA